jgi:hypothetical protein
MGKGMMDALTDVMKTMKTVADNMSTATGSSSSGQQLALRPKAKADPFSITTEALFADGEQAKQVLPTTVHDLIYLQETLQRSSQAVLTVQNAFLDSAQILAKQNSILVTAQAQIQSVLVKHKTIDRLDITIDRRTG